jgi:DNA repair exonuclease SbcCD ATPase subunit/DNA repair exonuclease SbcCD nuclease subunit
MQNSWKLAHIADVHVRTDRREEYAHVNDRLYESLREYRPDVIVVAGDVFDDKKAATADTQLNVAKFLEQLAAIAPLVMIPGNHDTNCAVPGSTDLLTPLLRNNAVLCEPRVRFWRDSGVYEAHGIQWIVFATDGGVEKMEELRTKAEADRKVWTAAEVRPQICLFHEEVNGAKLPNGTRLSSFRLSLEHLAAFDAALGGHIHMRQMFTPRAGYCGSLVQQTMGETRDGHGYMQWTVCRPVLPALAEVATRGVDLWNPWAVLRVSLDANGRDTTALPLPERPRYWELVHAPDAPAARITAAVAEYTALTGKPPRLVREIAGQTGGFRAEGLSVATVHAEAAKTETQIETARELLAGTKLAPDEAEEVVQRHAAAFAEITKNEGAGGCVRLKRLEFDNFVAFGAGNVVDFASLEGALSGVVAPNRAGKTALLDALQFVLFDETPRFKTKAEMVHEGADRCRIALTFEKDGVEGRIIKSFGKAAGSASKYDFYFDGPRTGATINDTKTAIAAVVGTAAAARMTAFKLQGNDVADFVGKSHLERKALVAGVLGLGALETMAGAAEIELKETKAALTALERQKIENPGDVAAAVAECEAEHETASTAAAAAAAKADETGKVLAAAEAAWAAGREEAAGATATARAAEDTVARVQDAAAAAENRRNAAENELKTATAKLAGMPEQQTSLDETQAAEELAAAETAWAAGREEAAGATASARAAEETVARARETVAAAENRRIVAENELKAATAKLAEMPEQQTSLDETQAAEELAAAEAAWMAGRAEVAGANAAATAAKENAVRAQLLALAAGERRAAAETKLAAVLDALKKCDGVENVAVDTRLSGFADATTEARQIPAAEIEQALNIAAETAAARFVWRPEVAARWEKLSADNTLKQLPDLALPQAREQLAAAAEKAQNMKWCGRAMQTAQQRCAAINRELVPTKTSAAEAEKQLQVARAIGAQVAAGTVPELAALVEKRDGAQKRVQAQAYLAELSGKIRANEKCAECRRVQKMLQPDPQAAKELETAETALVQTQERLRSAATETEQRAADDLKMARLQEELQQLQVEIAAAETAENELAELRRLVGCLELREELAELTARRNLADSAAKGVAAAQTLAAAAAWQRRGERRWAEKRELVAAANHAKERAEELAEDWRAAEQAHEAAKQLAETAAAAAAERQLAAEELKMQHDQAAAGATAAAQTAAVQRAAQRLEELAEDWRAAEQAHAAAKQLAETTAAASAERQTAAEKSRMLRDRAAAAVRAAAQTAAVLRATQRVNEVAEDWRAAEQARTAAKVAAVAAAKTAAERRAAAETLKAGRDEAAAAARTAAEAAAAAQARVYGVAKTLNSLRLRLQTAEELTAGRDAAAREWRLAKARVNLLGANGIADKMLDRVRGAVEKAMLTALAELGADFEVSLSDKWELVLRNRGNAQWRAIGSASGYQQFAMGLAARLALWRVTLTPKIDAFIIDEGFGTCDAENLQRAAEAITALAGTAGGPRLLLVATHVAELQAKLDRVLVIERLAGGSKVCNAAGALLEIDAQAAAVAAVVAAAAAVDEPDRWMVVDADDPTRWKCVACDKTLKGKPAQNHPSTKSHLDAVRKYLKKRG